MSRARKPEEGIMVVLDVGKGMVSGPNPRAQDAKRALQGLVQSLILFRSKSQFGLILFGTTETKNELEYPNCVFLSPLSSPSVSALKAMGEVEVGSEDGDWMDGLVLAVDALATSECKRRRIILITDGCGEPSEVTPENFDAIIGSINKYQIHIDILGADLFNSSKEIEENQNKMMNMVMLSDVAERVGGRKESLETAVMALTQLRTRTVMQRSLMSGALEISEDVKLPFKTYTHGREEKFPKMTRRSSLAPDSKVERETTYFTIDRPDVSIEKDQLVKAYRYGRTYVPFNEVDRQLELVPDTCMRLIGFTKTANVPRSDFMSSPNVIVPDGGQNVLQAYSSLVQALYESDRIGIVRLAARKKVHLGALIPHIKTVLNEETMENMTVYAFLYVHLPFSDDIRDYYFPSLDISKVKPEFRPSEEQLEATQDVIREMSLMGTDEDGDPVELLKPKHTFNPVLQHFYRCLGYRALNPDKPLPVREPAFDEYLSSDRFSDCGKKALNRFSDLFVFEKVEKSGEKRKRLLGDGVDEIEALVTPLESSSSNAGEPATKMMKKEGDSENKISFESLLQSKTSTVGFVDPVGDFNRILERKDDDLVDSAISGLINCIEQMVRESVQDQQYPKAMECVISLRIGCIEQAEPEPFNNFLRGLRETCEGKRRNDFWNLVLDQKITLISSEETNASTVLPDEAQMFMEGKYIEGESMDMGNGKEEEEASSAPVESDEDADDLLSML